MDVIINYILAELLATPSPAVGVTPIFLEMK